MHIGKKPEEKVYMHTNVGQNKKYLETLNMIPSILRNFNSYNR